MTDRELLESLGYRAEHSNSAGEWWVKKDDRHRILGGGRAQTEDEAWTAASYSLEQHTEFWLELDDALAKQGWNTTLSHQPPLMPEFKYVAHFPVVGPEFESTGATRNAAVRSVYEQIHLERKEANGN